MNSQVLTLNKILPRQNAAHRVKAAAFDPVRLENGLVIFWHSENALKNATFRDPN